MTALRPLPRRWYAGGVLDLAPALLGALLVRQTDAGRIVLRLTEVEAYAGEDDPGSHAFRGRTPRNAVMFGPPGHAYVYFTYGMHFCMNVVTGAVGNASAVLLRAGEVVEGEDVVRRRRGAVPFRDLARGPARLTVALDVDRDFDGHDLTRRGALYLAEGAPSGGGEVLSGPRVGVAGAGASTPWRFWLAGEPSVSVYRPAVPRRRRSAG